MRMSRAAPAPESARRPAVEGCAQVRAWRQGQDQEAAPALGIFILKELWLPSEPAGCVKEISAN